MAVSKAGLSREAVVRIALRLVDDGGIRGYDDLTLARVAAG
jgi:DNA-binding Lrp family transcriptional regulator